MRRIKIISILALLCSLTGCSLFRPAVPDPLLTVNSDSITTQYAGLPAYLVPAPTGSTPRQVRQWQAAQRAALKNSTKPASVKLKNVGNVLDKSKVKDQSTIKDQSKVKDQATTKDKAKHKPDHRDQSTTDHSTGIAGGQALTAGVVVVALLLFLVYLFRSKNAKTIA